MRKALTRKKNKKTRRHKGGQSRCLFTKTPDNEGLGNQLFLYAVALGTLGTKADTISLCKIAPAASLHNPAKNYRNMFNGTKVNEANVKQRLNAAKNVGSSKNLNSVNGNARIPVSLYQGYDRVADSILKVKDNLIRNEFSKPEYKEIFQKDSQKTAFMHVRLGDYKERGWSESFTYYDGAIVELFKRAPHLETIYILSDTIEECLKRKDGWQKSVPGKELIFVGSDTKPMNELQTLYIMMNCLGGAVLSASTFSAWGAMLGPDTNPNSTIIYTINWSFIHNYESVEDKENPWNFPARWIKYPSK